MDVGDIYYVQGIYMLQICKCQFSESPQKWSWKSSRFEVFQPVIINSLKQITFTPLNRFMFRLAIFASGEGTNAQKFIDYYKNRKDISVSLIVSNRREAGVVNRAKENDISCLIVDKETLYNNDKVLNELKEKADFIILAGFLRMVPDNIINAFKGKIVNIHPALLPDYGGKGMYGARVHEAVIANKEVESGITIHYVTDKYDEGEIIFQAKCPVEAIDTAESLAKKVHELEYKFYPVIVDKLLLENIS
jgi:phosphoribosylglycinamide formyltransferase 1